MSDRATLPLTCTHDTWTHALCTACWRHERGLDTPHRLVDDEPTPCCVCGTRTAAGIYVRRAPTATP